jgi:hypothetical protein
VYGPYTEQDTDLATRMMSQVSPLNVEPAMVKGVNHFVHNRVLHVLLAEESILTQENPVFWMEPSRTCRWTGMTLYRSGRESTAGETKVFHHENHSRT